MTPTLVYGTGFEGGFFPTNWSSPHNGSGSLTIPSGGKGGVFYANGYWSAGQSGFQYFAADGGIDPGDDFYISFYHNHAGTESNFYIYLTDGTYISLNSNGNGVFRVGINGTVVAYALHSQGHGTWMHHEIHVKIADSDGKIEYKQDGILSVSYTGDTKPGTSSTLDYFYARSDYSITDYGSSLDDFSICVADWPGDLRFSAFLPASDSVIGGFFENGTSNSTPPDVCTSAIGAATGITGTYRYKTTFVDANGETLSSVVSSPDISPANQKVDLSSIPTGPTGTTSRKIYRNKNGGTIYYLVTTIANNTATTYTDSTADASITVVEPINELWNKLSDNSDATYIYTQADLDKYTIGMAASWGDVNKQPLALVRFTRVAKDSTASMKIKLSETYLGTEVAGSEIELTVAVMSICRVLTELPGGITITKDSMLDLLLSGESHL